jgi:antitoxin ParD1/3/4
MPTRNVVLTDHQQDVIETLVESGRYQNASEVLREGLRLIERREREDALKLEALRQATRVGLADLAAGRFTDVQPDGIDTFIAGLGAEAGKRAGNAA